MHLMSLADTGIFSSISTDMLMGIFDSVTDLIPIVIPVVVAFAGFYKAWGFLKKNMKG